MKKNRLLYGLALCGVLLLCFLLPACHGAERPTEDPEMDALLEEAYNALYTEDEEAFRALLHPDTLFHSPDDGQQAIQSLVDFIQEPLGEYRAVSRQTSRQSTVLQKQAIYAISLEGKDYHINLAYREDANGTGLAAFRLDEATAEAAGFTWPDSPGGWVVFGFMVLSAVFMVFTFIVCCRDEVKLKALMILMILLGNVGALFTTGEGRAQCQLLFFQLGTSVLQTFENGFALRLFLPVGAIVYWCLRRLLRKPPDMPHPAEMDSPPTSAPEAPGTGDPADPS